MVIQKRHQVPSRRRNIHINTFLHFFNVGNRCTIVYSNLTQLRFIYPVSLKQLFFWCPLTIFCTFHKTLRTHLLVLHVSLSYGGLVLLFTFLINHVPTAVAPKPYIVRALLSWLRMIRWMWWMIYRESCLFPLRPSLVDKPCSLTLTLWACGDQKVWYSE